MCDSANYTSGGLYPPPPRSVQVLTESLLGGTAPSDLYSLILETQCGVTDDSQPVEQYDGTLVLRPALLDPDRGQSVSCNGTQT